MEGGWEAVLWTPGESLYPAGLGALARFVSGRAVGLAQPNRITDFPSWLCPASKHLLLDLQLCLTLSL